MSLDEQFRASAGLGRVVGGPASPFESVETVIFPRDPVPVSDGLARSIEFRPKEGPWWSFPYHTLTAIEYMPHGRITLWFARRSVVVAGRNLCGVKNSIRRHVLDCVAETERTDLASLDASVPVIDKVELKGLAESTDLSQAQRHGYDPHVTS